jgi:hypothetical protein
MKPENREHTVFQTRRQIGYEAGIRGILGSRRLLFFKLKLYTLAKPRQHAYCALTAIKLQKVRGRVIYCKYPKGWA